MAKGKKRPLAQALPVAQEIVAKLAPYCLDGRIQVAGSVRRRRSWVGDLEIVACAKYPPALFGPDYTQPSFLDRFLEEKKVPLLLGGQRYKEGKREKQKRFMYAGYQVDLFLAVPENWGLILWLRTGSDKFNKWIVKQKSWGGAMPYGMKSTGGFLWRGDERIDTPEEIDFFQALELPFIPPEYRSEKKWHAFLEEAETE